MKTITKEQLLEMADESVRPQLSDLIDRAHERGDGIAVYTNQAFDHSNFGHMKFASFGSEEALLEPKHMKDGLPPTRLPDMGGQINWAYQFTHTCRRP